MNKKAIGVGLLSVAASVWAAMTWGPFIVKNYYPQITNLAYDQNQEMHGAATIPRLVMNKSVESIKAGDIVRFIYPDGKVYDMETEYQCSAIRSASCIYRKITPVPCQETNTCPAPVSEYQKDRVRGDPKWCSARDVEYSLPTGYWKTNHTVVNNVITTTSSYISTGYQTVTVTTYFRSGRGCE